MRDDIGLLVYGRKTYQLMVPFWPEVAKNQSMTKASNEFALALIPSTRLFFHDHWAALKIKIRELFVRILATKYLN
jgi:hypothetical protein